ncbi:MAG TPA: tRNA lysidine(34) synthetase TilS [Syntrophorhabdaceae bacterium]|nr:tRNA lysidine(34) synthetase TilS [Syntrophorhabdaceae bacterium]
MDLLEKTKRLITEKLLIKPNENVLIGVSGGIDSVVLFHLLFSLSEKIPFKIGVAHVNHLLRGKESDRDEFFVMALAKKHNVPFYKGSFDVKAYAKQKGLSLQHAAREIRYAFFYDVAKAHNYDKIAIGHNLDDQVETFLLRLIKGTGLKGLSAIPIERERIIRPLLFTYRTEIETYAKAHDIEYVEDSSNRKTYYERNFIRKHIIPLMETLNPSFKEKIFLLLKDITDINKVFQNLSSEFLKEKLFFDREELWCENKALTALDPETRFWVLNSIIGMLESNFILLREHVRQIEKVVNSNKPNVSITLPWNIKVKRQYNRVIFTKKSPEKTVEGIFDIHEGINFLAPFGIIVEVERYKKKDLMPFVNPVEDSFSENIAFFDYNKIGKLSVRSFLDGDRFVPLGMKEKIKVKDFFISRKIPLEKRRRIPLILSDNEIAWIIGYRIDDRFKVTDNTEWILKMQALPLSNETPLN